jgi:RimJ/RimL family protein N-acetyltransferase
MVIRRLSPSDVINYRQLRLHALRECPAAFGSSYSEEVKRPLKAFVSRVKQTRIDWAFGAFDKDRLVGVLNLSRENRMKEKHKASIFGMYVAMKMRRKGIGRELLKQAVGTAKGIRGLRQVRLAVVETNRPALRLYQDCGFEIYGREEAALFVNGTYYAMLFLVRRL